MIGVDQETQLNIVKLEIERQLQRAYECRTEKLKKDDLELLNTFIADCEDLNLMLADYQSKEGRFRRFKRAKVIAKITKKVIGFKRKYKDLNPKLNEIMGAEYG